MAWNIPLPAGAAGADPATLARAGRGLETRMRGGIPDINTLAQEGGAGYESTVDPYWWLDYQKYGTGAEQWGMSFEEQIRQFDATIAHELALSQSAEAGATKRAQIAASASTGAADIHAQAAIQSAQIAAAEARYRSDTLMKMARLDNATKLQIAQEANKIEAMKWEATKFQHPSKWAEQEAWFAAGGAPAIKTPTRSVVPQMPGGPVIGSAAGAQAAGWGGPSALDITAPQAVVGEAGPELATVTPQGIQIQPIPQQQAGFLKQQGMRSMQQGGWLQGQASSPYGTTAGGFQRVSPAPGPRGQRVQGIAEARRASLGQPTGPISFMPGIGFMRGRTPIGGTGAGLQIGGVRGAPTGAGGGGAGRGGGAAGGAAGGTTAAGAAPATTDPTRSVLSYLRGEEPYPAWGGQELAEFQVPGGENYGIVPLPGQINLIDFLNLPYDMQQMYLSATQATYSMTPETTMQGMTYFAPRGIAQPVAIWG